MLFVEPDRLFQKERGVVELRAAVAGVPELERAASRQLGLAPSTRLKLLWTEPVMGITDELWSLAELQQMRPEEVVGVALREPGEMVRAPPSINSQPPAPRPVTSAHTHAPAALPTSERGLLCGAAPPAAGSLD
eukprot:COSAG01_NODE_2143_length_8317_cov_24.964103_13_plen_134_part_00